MAGPTDKQIAYEGLANLSNSIRRSTAMYVAMQMTPEDGSLDEMLEIFERIATAIRGTAPEQTGPRKMPWMEE